VAIFWPPGDNLLNAPFELVCVPVPVPVPVPVDVCVPVDVV
jgi:hypothetical protein